MREFFYKLFSSESFMPHGHCYLWRPEILWLHVISDAIIAAAYASIPFALIYLVRKRKDLAFNWVFTMFGIFILACGTTHVISIWTVWEPVYRIDGLMKGVTALASLATAVALWPLLPRVLALPSSAQLEAANAALRREIFERTRAEQALAERNQALVVAERLKSDFIANVSHELRTPLTLILAPTESLMAKHSELSTIDQQTLGTIHNNALRMLQLVNGLLDFERLEAHQVTVNREAIDVKQLTANLLADFAALMQQRQLRAEFVAPQQELLRAIDRFLYERIVFNLLSNAVKFTPAGGTIVLRIETKGPDRLRVSVQDSGLGISASDQQQLFKKFQQLEASSTRRFEGTGLGLALVKEFVELLDGEVSVESQVGRGSTFTVEFAAAPTLKNAIPLHRGETAWSADSLRSSDGEPQNPDLPLVLIAEDNQELARHIQVLLQDVCRSHIVGDGESALHFAQEEQPDLILSDVMMPLRDGISLCKEIKSQFKTAKIPFIMLSALTHREALLKGWDSGADEYLFKPFHPTELVTRIRSILKRQAFIRLAEVQGEQLLRERIQLEEAEKQIQKLQKIETELRRINRVKDEFLATISHELRTPMVAIVGWSELLQQSEIDASEYPVIFETLHRNARSQSDLIESLLDISRINTGKLMIEVQPVLLSDLIDEALATVQLSSEAKYLRIDLHIERDAPSIQGDPSRLKQVIWNLLSNAIKFSKPGGKIEIGLQARKTYLELWVQDEGEGIDPDFLPHVFERFLQENQSYRRKHGGLGLGLSIVQHIVDLHGATIQAESPGKGQGARFVIRFNTALERA